MMAFVGFASVYANRGELPIQALKAHIADPGQQNSEPTHCFAAACTPALALHWQEENLCHTSAWFVFLLLASLTENTRKAPDIEDMLLV